MPSIDAQTLQEVTTKYDSRGCDTVRTVWLTPLGQVDSANPPIYTGPPVNHSASPPAAPYGLTTTYAYDDNLTDSTGLDATFSAHLASTPRALMQSFGEMQSASIPFYGRLAVASSIDSISTRHSLLTNSPGMAGAGISVTTSPIGRRIAPRLRAARVTK